MPLIKGSSRSTISQNIRELHKGPTFAHTSEKFGKGDANRQAVAIALETARKTKKKKRKGYADGGSPMSDEDQAAMMPETFANPAVKGAISGLATLPQRAIQNSQYSLDTGNYDPGPALEAATLPMGTGAIAGVPVRAGEAVLGAGPIRAYHGSPHDFDAFSMDKIGTGEGAQAYGHGLYFAEAEPVAKQYRDQLQWKGANFDDPQVLAQNAIDRLGDRQAAADNLQSSLDSVNRFHRGKPPPSQAAANEQTQKAIDLLRGNEPITGKPNAAGKMYEVNINADPEHFLDWDKPLSPDALAKVQAAAQNIKPNLYERMMGEGKDLAKWGLQPENVRPDITGQSAIGALKRGLGSDAAASQALREAGIPGIKYLDQGSRPPQSLADTKNSIKYYGDMLQKEPENQFAADQLKQYQADLAKHENGSRNYVAFDDKLISILRKYGIAGLPAGAAAMAARGKDDKMAKGGAVNAAMDVARRTKRAKGGKVHVGPIIGDTGGRADERPINVPDSCYVIPADVVSGLGQGNTLHGVKVIGLMFPQPRAKGGKVSVPIAAADGEVVIGPEQLEAKFGGDLDHAHKLMDGWVKHERQNIIRTMQQLPGPAQD